MKILYYDCFAGISGDMNLAALIDLGVDPDHLRTELSKLGLDNEFEVHVSRDSRNGIHGTRVDVLLRQDGEDGHAHCHSHEHEHCHAHSHDHGHDHAHEHHHDHEHAHGHDHSHDHDHAHSHNHDHAHCHEHAHEHCHEHPHDHSHEHDHEHAHEHGHDHCHGHDHAHGHGHAHRNFGDIKAIIEASGLAPQVRETALRMFGKVAAAEAHVHNAAIDTVHFHEVGATDSIVDIVGAAICLHALGVDAVWASPVELGGGFVECAHGTIPVPAPATVEILHDIPTTRGAVQQETTTPTGAAILASTVDRFTTSPAMTVEKTAYGIGHRESDFPNLLRVYLAEVRDEEDGARFEDACMLQCNIDDMTAEALGVTMDALMDAGAMDVHFTPIQMKKNRPATCVSVLCAPEEAPRFERLIFLHTATLGIKRIPLQKRVLEKKFETLETELGPVTMKLAIMDGNVLRAKPELEDCRRLAEQHGLRLDEVQTIVSRAADLGFSTTRN